MKTERKQGAPRKFITPAMAKKWLEESNTNNRNLSKALVNKLANDILTGEWKHEHHQGIAFYKDGILADGQHRLSAIVKANRGVWMLVSKDLDRATGATIDKHRPRSDADSISIGGLSDWIGSQEVSVINALAGVHGTSTNKLSTKQLVDIGNIVKEETSFAVNAFTTRQAKVTTAPVMAAIAIASDYYDKTDIQDFVNVLTTGMTVKPEDMVAVRLRETLLTKDKGRGSTGRDNTIKLVLNAIKAYMEKKVVKQLRTPKELPMRLTDLDEAI